MTPEMVGALLTGLTGLITAAAGFYTVRRKNSDAHASANYKELLSLRRENERLRRTTVLYARWTHRMNVAAEQAGVSLPDQPDELRDLLRDGEASSGTFQAVTGE